MPPTEKPDSKPGQGARARKCLIVVYTYKNLGPRECGFSFGDLLPRGPGEIQLRTAKGHFFPCTWEIRDRYRLNDGWERVAGTWQPQVTAAIDRTGEGALAFVVPNDEIPTEVVVKLESVKLDGRLPKGPYGLRADAGKEWGALFLPFTAAAPQTTVMGTYVSSYDATARIELRPDGTFRYSNYDVRKLDGSSHHQSGDFSWNETPKGTPPARNRPILVRAPMLSMAINSSLRSRSKEPR